MSFGRELMDSDEQAGNVFQPLNISNIYTKTLISPHWFGGNFFVEIKQVFSPNVESRESICRNGI